MAVDVDEPGLGEQAQQQPDAARVRRRLQQQRAAVLPRQLLEEQHEGVLPLVDLSLGDAPERQVAVVVAGPPGEDPADVGRAEGHRADGELVLVGRVGGLADVIHRAGRREHRPDEPGGAGFGGQEGVRVRGLVDVRGGEPPVGGQQVVQVRRAAPPVAEDEHRRRHVHRHDLREVGALLVAADGGVDEALRGDRLRPRPVGRVDGEPVLPQQAQPVPAGDTGEEARPDRLEDSFTPRHQGSRPVLRDHERRSSGDTPVVRALTCRRRFGVIVCFPDDRTRADDRDGRLLYRSGLPACRCDIPGSWSNPRGATRSQSPADRIVVDLRSSAPFPARQPTSRSQGSLSSGHPAGWRR